MSADTGAEEVVLRAIDHIVGDGADVLPDERQRQTAGAAEDLYEELAPERPRELALLQAPSRRGNES